MPNLRFNESLHPDEILKALLVDNWGSISLVSWPPEECTERNQFRLMALRKIHGFLDMAEYVQMDGGPKRTRKPEQDESADSPRLWAYARFPAVQAALQAGIGPYRSCTFESRISISGSAHHSYHLPDDGLAPPGLENDWATVAFVRALVQTDLRTRIEALQTER